MMRGPLSKELVSFQSSIWTYRTCCWLCTITAHRRTCRRWSSWSRSPARAADTEASTGLTRQPMQPTTTRRTTGESQSTTRSQFGMSGSGGELASPCAMHSPLPLPSRNGRSYRDAVWSLFPSSGSSAAEADREPAPLGHEKPVAGGARHLSAQRAPPPFADYLLFRHNPFASPTRPPWHAHLWLADLLASVAGKLCDAM